MADLTVTVEGESVRVGDVVFSADGVRVFLDRLYKAAREAENAKWARERREKMAKERAQMLAFGWVDGPDPRWLWRIVPGKAPEWHDTYGHNIAPQHLPPGIRVRVWGGRLAHVTEANGTSCACGEWLGSARVLADDVVLPTCKAHR